MIIAIVGATGTGKTRQAIELAVEGGAEIVNCDSREIYRGLDIGSAKPTAAERAGVPHHLFDVVDPDDTYDAARYAAAARAAIAEITGRGRRVVVVGGTGLYLRALRFGLFTGPPGDPGLRTRWNAEEDAAPGALHARLARLDPDSAARLHANDRLRLVRALEVLETTGRPLSAWHGAHRFAGDELPMRVVGLQVARADLYARLDARCAAMLDAGLLDEVRGLVARYDPTRPALQSIGYRQVAAHLRGECDLPAALEAMRRATRQFAKRQLTWFRAEPGIEWIDADESAPHLWPSV